MINPELTCCFTGHRPEKLHQPKASIIPALEREIDSAAASGYTAFISGMATGVDLWAADIVLLKGLRLIAAMPYAGYKVSSSEYCLLFRKALSGADEIVYCSEKYSRKSYFLRDRWMVDNSSLVIAVYHGEKGGTEQTIRYALEQGKDIKYCR